jgi:hypothetical protein
VKYALYPPDDTPVFDDLDVALTARELLQEDYVQRIAIYKRVLIYPNTYDVQGSYDGVKWLLGYVPPGIHAALGLPGMYPLQHVVRGRV